MKKFTDCNIIEVLEDIMRHNTERYQSDFEYDKETITKSAYSHYESDKTLIWISRRNGTHCFLERNAFVADTAAYNTTIFCARETGQPIIAYAVELKGFKDGLPSGDLYGLDITEFAKTIKEKAVPAHHILLIYNDGVSTIPYVPIWGTRIKEMDRLVRAIVLPVDLKQWDEAVNVVQSKRRQDTYFSDWDISKLENNFSKTKKSEMEM